ncbi:hypothetical protein MMC32_000251 [Xylographa parallela]|nr:hypothetical protein [Xylographa parallela]
MATGAQPSRMLWNKAEIRLVAFLRTGLFLKAQEVAEQLIVAATQIPLSSHTREYNTRVIYGIQERVKSEVNVFTKEPTQMNGKLPYMYSPTEKTLFLRTARESELGDPRLFAEKVKSLAQFRSYTVYSLENLFWTFRRERVILGDELDEPRSWPLHWMVYLVDAWKQLRTIDGAVDEHGKVINYNLLAELMNGKLSFHDKKFDAFDVEKAELQAIKWGFLRSTYAEHVIQTDGDGLRVSRTLSGPSLPPPTVLPASQRVVLPSISQLGLTSAETATIPAHMRLAPMRYHDEMDDDGQPGPSGS